jgi:hypothetical protein
VKSNAAKPDPKVSEWASLWFRLSTEDKAILRGLMLIRQRTYEVKRRWLYIQAPQPLHIIG